MEKNIIQNIKNVSFPVLWSYFRCALISTIQPSEKSFGSKILRLIKITSLFHESFSLTSVFGNSVLVCVCGFFILIRLINNGKSLWSLFCFVCRCSWDFAVGSYFRSSLHYFYFHPSIVSLNGEHTHTLIYVRIACLFFTRLWNFRKI